MQDHYIRTQAVTVRSPLQIGCLDRAQRIIGDGASLSLLDFISLCITGGPSESQVLKWPKLVKQVSLRSWLPQFRLQVWIQARHVPLCETPGIFKRSKADEGDHCQTACLLKKDDCRGSNHPQYQCNQEKGHRRKYNIDGPERHLVAQCVGQLCRVPHDGDRIQIGNGKAGHLHLQPVSSAQSENEAIR